MTTPLALTTSGKSTLYRPAERAVVTIKIHSEGPSQQQVSEEVTDRSNELRAILKEMALKDNTGEAAPEAPITHWSMKALSTGSTVPRDQEGKKLPREFKATTTFSVRFHDFDELGSFSSMLSTKENVSVQQILWELTDDTKASLGTESRVAAIKDATDQAKDYAEALTRGKVTATEVICGNGGVYSYPHYAGYHRMSRRRSGTGGGAGGEDLNFEPENVSFTCNVTVKYEAA